MRLAWRRAHERRRTPSQQQVADLLASVIAAIGELDGRDCSCLLHPLLTGRLSPSHDGRALECAADGWAAPWAGRRKGRHGRGEVADRPTGRVDTGMEVKRTCLIESL